MRGQGAAPASVIAAAGRLSAPDAPTVKASVLYTPLSKAVRKSCLCRGRPSEKRLGLTRGEHARERLKHGVRVTQARGRALADSQDQRRPSNLATSRLVGSLAWTIDMVCAELGKQDAEMPGRRTELEYNISSFARAVLLPLAGPHPRPHSIRAVLLPLAGPHPRPHLSFYGVYV